MRQLLVLTCTLLAACSGKVSDAITLAHDAGGGIDAGGTSRVTIPKEEASVPEASVTPSGLPDAAPSVLCAPESTAGLTVVACKLGLDVVPLGVTEDSVLLLSGQSTYSLLRIDKATGSSTKAFASIQSRGTSLHLQTSVQFAGGMTYWNEGETGDGWYAPGVSEVDSLGHLRLVFSDLGRLFAVDESAVYAHKSSLDPDGYIYRSPLSGGGTTRLGRMSDEFLGAKAGFLYAVTSSSRIPNKRYVQIQRMATTGGAPTVHLDPIRLSEATFKSQATLNNDGAIYYAIDYGGDTDFGQCGLDTPEFSEQCVKRIDPANPGQAQTVLRVPSRRPYEALPTAVRVYGGRVFLRTANDLRWGRLGGTVGDTGITLVGDNLSAPVFYENTGYVTYRRGGGDVPLETILVSFSLN